VRPDDARADPAGRAAEHRPHPVLRRDRPLVFAHRGGARLAPENTVAAFREGLARGADGLELDVRLSRDGVVVVHHDASVDRTTDGRGRVADLTADALAGLDAGCRFLVAGRTPFRGRAGGVPTLGAVLAAFPDTPIIIELKGTDARDAVAVIAEIRRAGASGRVCLGGYAWPPLAAARAAAPEIATSAAREEVRWALYRSWVGISPGRVGYRGFQVPEMSGRTRVVSPRFVRAAHRAGLAVQVWTVDEEDDIRRLLSWGVDAIISDRPDVAVRVRDEWLAGRPDEAGS
jgi:glycerophosphoryl diester phosphodiesterase